MSKLSDLLASLLESKNLNINRLSKMTGISRATLHHYVHGTRPIQKEEHLKTIINALALSPRQLEELKTAYLIETIGEPLYRQRLRMFDFFRNLGSIKEGTLLEEFNGAELWDEDWTDAEEKSCVITGRNQVLLTIYSVFSEASKNGGKVLLYADPASRGLKTVLNSPGMNWNQSDFIHIFRLEAVNFNQENHNADIIKAVFDNVSVISNYTPLYFYESFSDAEYVFPLTEFIVGEGRIVQFSKECDYAITHTQKEVVDLFRHIFGDMSKKCQLLGHAFDFTCDPQGMYLSDIFSEIALRERSGDYPVIYISGSIAVANAWSTDLTRKYLQETLPAYQSLAESMTSYSDFLRSMQLSEKGTTVMQKDRLREFIKTGQTVSYDDAFVSGTFSAEDRKRMAEEFVRMIEEDNLKVALIEPVSFPVSERWNVLVFEDRLTLFHYSQYRCTVMPINERSFAYAAHDYFKSLIESEHTVRDESAARQIRQWVDEYLS